MSEIKEQDIWKDRYRGKWYRGSGTVSDIISCKKAKKKSGAFEVLCKEPFFVKQYDYGFSKSNF